MLEENKEKNNLLSTAAVFLAAKLSNKTKDLKLVHCVYKKINENYSGFGNQFEFFKDQILKSEMDLLIYNNFDIKFCLPFQILDNCKKILKHP